MHFITAIGNVDKYMPGQWSSSFIEIYVSYPSNLFLIDILFVISIWTVKILRLKWYEMYRPFKAIISW